VVVGRKEGRKEGRRKKGRKEQKLKEEKHCVTTAHRKMAKAEEAEVEAEAEHDGRALLKERRLALKCNDISSISSSDIVVFVRPSSESESNPSSSSRVLVGIGEDEEKDSALVVKEEAEEEEVEEERMDLLNSESESASSTSDELPELPCEVWAYGTVAFLHIFLPICSSFVFSSLMKTPTFLFSPLSV